MRKTKSLHEVDRLGHVLWCRAKSLTNSDLRVASPRLITDFISTPHYLGSCMCFQITRSIDAVDNRPLSIRANLILLTHHLAHDMSLVLGVQQPLRRCIFRLGARLQCVNGAFEPQSTTTLASQRFASRSNRPIGAPKSTSTKKIIQRRGVEPSTRKRQPGTSKNLSSLLNQLNVGKKTPPTEKVESSESKDQVATRTVEIPPTGIVESNEAKDEDTNEDASRTVEIDEQEIAIQERIVQNRTKLLWPGIWTFFAVTGTYGAFAYLDSMYANAMSDETQLPERTALPQTWYLTPEVIEEGFKVWWNELDKLTIGIVVASIGVLLMRKSSLPFWEKLPHITGEKRYTAFTYPFVHGVWPHLGQNMFFLCWFMPGVVRYLDGDLFHAATLFVTVPLITSYLQHFAFRWGLHSFRGLPINMGSSGAVAAMFGAFCVAYPDEKLWLPNFAVIRLDAKYWGLLFATWQLASLRLARRVKIPKGGHRPAYLVSHLDSQT